MSRTKFWSPLLLAVGLAPALLHLGSCGDPHLSSLEVEVASVNVVSGFAKQTHSYDISTDGADTIVVRATASEAAATIDWRLFIDGVFQDFQRLGTGSGEATFTVPPDAPSELQLDVNHNGEIGRYTLNINVPDPAAPVTATVPMYCDNNFFPGDLVNSAIELTVDPLAPVVAGQSFDAVFFGEVEFPEIVWNAMHQLLSSLQTRIAVVDGSVLVAAPRSGASGPAVGMSVVAPTTCSYDANGNQGLGAGPYPACDPANDTGDGGNTDCIGIGGVPISFNQCHMFLEAIVVDGTSDGCLACGALGDRYWNACAAFGACSIVPPLPLSTEVGTFLADDAPTRGPLFGTEEAMAFPPPTPIPDDPPGLIIQWPGLSSPLLLDCFTGSVTEGADETLIPAPDSALVSIPLAPCPFTCGDGVKDACEECDDGNQVDGDGCQADCTLDFCLTDPIDCSASAECLTDGVCDRLCEPGTGCERCPGQDLLQPDEIACGGGSGVCRVGECLPPSVFPCSETGIRAAINAGGGPYTFDCAGPTTIVLSSSLSVESNVILDGENLLTIDGWGFRIGSDNPAKPHVAVELRHMARTGSGGFSVYDTLILADVQVNDGSVNVTGDGQLVATNISVSGATTSAGVVVNGGATAAIVDSSITGNPVNGVSVCDGTFSASGSTISQNGSDGVSTCSSGPNVITLQNSSISENTQAGIQNSGNSTMTLVNVTVSGNLGYGLEGFDGTVAASVIADDCAGTAPSLGYNIESPDDTCGFADATDQVAVSSVALNLGPLQDNSGPTQTYLPGPGSVAIDAIPPADCLDADGLPLTTDQRGISRPQGTDCDIGAVEVEQP